MKKRVFKWWIGSKPEDIEAWLEGMASQGWNLIYVRWGGFLFHFQKGESGKIRYCVDYQSKQDQNYVNIFKDAGWEFIYSANGWYFWRMPYSGDRPEIYSDISSLIERNKRLLNMLTILLMCQIPLIAVITTNDWFNPIFMIIYVSILGIFGYGCFSIGAANKDLKRKSDGLD